MVTKKDSSTPNKNNIKGGDQDIWVEAVESLRKTKRTKSNPNQQMSLVIDENRKNRKNKLDIGNL